MSQRWQASAHLHAVVVLGRAEPAVPAGSTIVPFAVAPDLGNEWALADTDQRHRAVFNGIWEVGSGFQVSGLHYFGAGIRSAATYGGDLRGLGAGGSARLRPDGTIVPRNAYIQPAQNKTGGGLGEGVPMGESRGDRSHGGGVQRVQPAEWGHHTQESSTNYHEQTLGAARTVQLGFRLNF